jgi:hypothetical protein
MTLANNGKPIETTEEYQEVMNFFYEQAGINPNEPLVSLELPLKYAHEVFDMWATTLFELEEEFRETIDPEVREELEPVIAYYNDIYELFQNAIYEVESEQE